jgi:hypothetical protein
MVVPYAKSVDGQRPKLSDRGVRRGTCTAGGKVAVEAVAVTHGGVRCSAWLGLVRSATVHRLIAVKLMLSHLAVFQGELDPEAVDAKS